MKNTFRTIALLTCLSNCIAFEANSIFFENDADELRSFAVFIYPKDSERSLYFGGELIEAKETRQSLSEPRNYGATYRSVKSYLIEDFNKDVDPTGNISSMNLYEALNESLALNIKVALLKAKDSTKPLSSPLKQEELEMVTGWGGKKLFTSEQLTSESTAVDDFLNGLRVRLTDESITVKDSEGNEV